MLIKWQVDHLNTKNAKSFFYKQLKTENWFICVQLTISKILVMINSSSHKSWWKPSFWIKNNCNNTKMPKTMKFFISNYRFISQDKYFYTSSTFERRFVWKHFAKNKSTTILTIFSSHFGVVAYVYWLEASFSTTLLSTIRSSFLCFFTSKFSLLFIIFIF